VLRAGEVGFTAVGGIAVAVGEALLADEGATSCGAGGGGAGCGGAHVAAGAAVVYIGSWVDAAVVATEFTGCGAGQTACSVGAHHAFGACTSAGSAMGDGREEVGLAAVGGVAVAVAAEGGAGDHTAASLTRSVGVDHPTVVVLTALGEAASVEARLAGLTIAVTRARWRVDGVGSARPTARGVGGHTATVGAITVRAAGGPAVLVDAELTVGAVAVELALTRGEPFGRAGEHGEGPKHGAEGAGEAGIFHGNPKGRTERRTDVESSIPFPSQDRQRGRTPFLASLWGKGGMMRLRVTEDGCRH